MDTELQEKVCQLRERVADRIGTNRYRTWFGDSAEFRIDGGRLGVTVANAFVENWIRSNFLSDLREAGREVLGEAPDVDVRVVGTGERAAQQPPQRTNGPVPAAPGRGRAARERGGAAALRGELDSFVVGACNRMGYAAARAVAQSPGKAFKLLVLHGGCGLGKTHLLQGICNVVRREHVSLRWRYISGEEFTNEFVYAVKSGRVDSFRARFRKLDLLLIDDIHFLANKKATQEEFLHTFNAVDACGRAVVLSSDRHPRTIATLSDSLISRLIAGMVVEIEAPDFETRCAILERRAQAMRCDVPDRVLSFIAEKITRNVRELEGALYKLSALASLAGEPITLELTRAALREQLAHADRAPEPGEIEAAAATRFGVRRERLRSSSRDRTVCLARAATMYLVRKLTPLSFPEIGRALGNKNHSTVLMACKRIEKMLRDDARVSWKTRAGPEEANLRELVTGLERRLAEESG